ncbi:hypothetical protein [Salinimicrobium marinum]|nr:hypothetical protein [Salinimicrobium marinum]
MKNRVETLFLFTAFCFFTLFSVGQERFNPPPPDGTYMSHETQGCGDLDDSGTDPVVPPGLCMPINDYLIPLLIAGILLGAYKVHRIEVAK